jgi:hypothetical protein
MVLRRMGHAITQDDVFVASGLDPSLGRGCYTPDLKVAVEEIGFSPGEVWTRIDADDAEEALGEQFAALHEDLRKGWTSIVCMHYDERLGATEHFRLVVGYDPDADEVVYHEPAEEDGAYRRMDRSAFLRLWPLKYRPDRWTVVRLRMRPGDLMVAQKAGGRHSPADFAQHVRKLKGKVPSGFHVLVQSPFVVVGDESRSLVERRAERTVQWAVDRLKKDFFEKDPDEIITIWLFKNESSYRKHAKSIFGDEPRTPFGYFSEEENALIMNIATGGGTLVHEIVHPFMKANFPACPAWFNEGMGSLYEQCTDRDGHIHGLTNWRLPDLQLAIQAGDVPDFKELTATTDYEFYNEDPGTHYAQARYLCYYLQQKGLLRRFYREFRKNQAKDPTGYQTLKRVLGTDDMKEFKEEWEAFVLKLRFP